MVTTVHWIVLLILLIGGHLVGGHVLFSDQSQSFILPCLTLMTLLKHWHFGHHSTCGGRVEHSSLIVFSHPHPFKLVLIIVNVISFNLVLFLISCIVPFYHTWVAAWPTHILLTITLVSSPSPRDVQYIIRPCHKTPY